MKKIFKPSIYLLILFFSFIGVSFAEESDDNKTNYRTYENNNIEEDEKAIDETDTEKETEVKTNIPSDDTSTWPKYHMKEEAE
jgi:hypothetical protein